MKNKYYFFKKLYPDYVIIINIHDKKRSYRYDSDLIKYIKNDDINYIIVNNDFSVIKVEKSINKYKEYLLREFIWKLALDIDKC